MSQRILVLAAHPDDETLGCGGTLLRWIARGDKAYWLPVTCMAGFDDGRVEEREHTLAAVAAAYPLVRGRGAAYPATTLPTVPVRELITTLSNAIIDIQPSIVLIPHRGDGHSDHRALADAALAALKPHRVPSVRMVMSYEVPSETEHSLPGIPFVPNLFVDVTAYVERRMEIAALYGDEMLHPARTQTVQRALLTVRGAAIGVAAAEAFTVLRAAL